jgi:reprolysin-like metallo-peptidase family M12B
MKSLVLLLAACLLLGACGSSPPIANPTEKEQFEALFGAPYQGEDNIPFHTCSYDSSVPIPVFVTPEAAGIFSAEDWEKSFRFWEALIGREIFYFVDVPPTQGVIVSTQPQGDVGACGIIRISSLSPNATIPAWQILAHEEGHALGLEHSLATGCIMLSSSPPTAEGCDLSFLSQIF